MSSLYTFRLSTKENINAGSIFDSEGSPIGRILKKHPTFKDEYDEFEYVGNYSYDIESTKETFEKLNKGETKLHDISEYSVSNSSTYYEKKEN